MNERLTRVYHSKLCLVLPATPSTYIFPHQHDRLKVAEQVLIPDDFLVSELRLGIRIEQFIDPNPIFAFLRVYFRGSLHFQRRGVNDTNRTMQSVRTRMQIGEVARRERQASKR